MVLVLDPDLEGPPREVAGAGDDLVDVHVAALGLPVLAGDLAAEDERAPGDVGERLGRVAAGVAGLPHRGTRGDVAGHGAGHDGLLRVGDRHGEAGQADRLERRDREHLAQQLGHVVAVRLPDHGDVAPGVAAGDRRDRVAEQARGRLGDLRYGAGDEVPVHELLAQLRGGVDRGGAVQPAQLDRHDRGDLDAELPLQLGHGLDQHARLGLFHQSQVGHPLLLLVGQRRDGAHVEGCAHPGVVGQFIDVREAQVLTLLEAAQQQLLAEDLRAAAAGAVEGRAPHEVVEVRHGRDHGALPPAIGCGCGCGAGRVRGRLSRARRRGSSAARRRGPGPGRPCRSRRTPGRQRAAR